MGKLEKMGELLVPFARVIGQNRYLNAIKDGFINIMPLLILGSLVVVLNNVILDWGENSLWYSLGIHLDQSTVDTLASFKIFGSLIWQGTLAIISLLITFTIAYNFTNNEGYDGISAGVLSVASFFVIQDWNIQIADEAGEVIATSFSIPPSFLDGTNIITAILVSLVTATIFVHITKRNWTIKMPEGVPPGVAKAFSALIPGAIIIGLFALIASVLSAAFDTNLSVWITDVIATPLQKIGAEGPLVAYIYVTLSNILYFFGIHGPNVLSFIDLTVLTPAAVENANALQAGLEPSIIFTKGMLDSFVFIGGGGATLGLIIAILIGSKRTGDRTIAKFALPAGIFNINEPLVFGLPIVLNPIYFIPFVLMPPILLTTAWIQIEFFNALGLLAHTGATLIPWVSPVGIGAFLAYQSFTAIIIAVVQLALSIIIYLPFVYASNKVKEEQTVETTNE